MEHVIHMSLNRHQHAAEGERQRGGRAEREKEERLLEHVFHLSFSRH
jgi:hypothetical protein